MKVRFAVAAMGLAVASASAHAEDLFSNMNSNVDVGGGWYLRGDVGYGAANAPTIVPQDGLIPQVLTDVATGASYVNQPIGDASNPVDVTRGNNMTAGTPSFNIGFGYRFNDHVRMDATYSYWSGANYSYSQKTLCPGTAVAVSNNVYQTTAGVQSVVSVPVGYAWSPNVCDGQVNASQHNQSGLVNAYFDIAHIAGFTPYIGGGLGINANTITGSSAFYNQNDGSAYAGNTSAPGGAPLQWVVAGPVPANAPQSNTVYYTALGTQPNVTFGQQNWNRTINTTRYSLAWAAMFGFSYKLSTDVLLDVGYRYLSSTINGLSNNLQELRVGVRILAD